MPNRRQFIQSGLALSAVSLPAVATLTAQGASAGAAPALLLKRFVVDERLPDAVVLGRAAASHGIEVTSTAGDLTALWLDDFRRRWRQAPMALAGATTQSGLFVLETLAGDHGMRVVYRGEHRRPRDDVFAHVLGGPLDLLARAAPRRGAALDWASLASAMTRCPLGRTEAGRIELRSPAGYAGAGKEPLFTWIIAPRNSLTARA